jgi:hypothetical protein
MMSFLDDIKLPIREVIAVVVFCTTLFGFWYDITRQLGGIPTAIRLGDVKGEIQSLNMELSYMEGSPRDEKAERLYQSKTRTLARLEEEWAELQK